MFHHYDNYKTCTYYDCYFCILTILDAPRGWCVDIFLFIMFLFLKKDVFHFCCCQVFRHDMIWRTRQWRYESLWQRIYLVSSVTVSVINNMRLYWWRIFVASSRSVDTRTSSLDSSLLYLNVELAPFCNQWNLLAILSHYYIDHVNNLAIYFLFLSSNV